MGAWATLVLAVRFSVYNIQVMGDSKIVIDWLRRKGDLTVANLDAWKERIVEFYHLFRSITFPYIYREANYEADSQSKKALHSYRQRISYTLWMDMKVHFSTYLFNILTTGFFSCMSMDSL
jgi:hypothetical protein